MKKNSQKKQPDTLKNNLVEMSKVNLNRVDKF